MRPPPALGRPAGILQQLWQSRGSDAADLSPEYLRDQVLMLLVGGHETTATTLCWALHCLMPDRPARDQLRDELRRAGAESEDLERLRELPYLGAVIDESMRLYPIGR
jgi:cytochrome P450